jgi:two-component system response regulator PilR (NtrC family)
MFPLLRKKKRVLLLDDDASMRKLISLLLQRAGYRVDAVDNGNAATGLIERTKYDAILLDLMMPHEGGMTVIRRLRETKPDLLARVIVVTAMPEAVLRTVAAGVSAIVKKPFDAQELIETVRRVA